MNALRADVDELRRRLAANRREQALLRSEEATLAQELAEREATLATAASAPSTSSAASSSASGSGEGSWAGAHPWDGDVARLLKSRFGHTSFRPLQREVVNACLAGRDVFAILPTGGGKSLTFQLPPLLEPSGVTLVVSPLVSLMQDQVRSLRRLSLRAELLAEGAVERAQASAILAALADAACSGLRFLYVTPERVAKSKLLLAKLQTCYAAGRLQRVVVDEAHCCAAQGHDFRPDYLSLSTLRASFPNVPILALTATASAAVVSDVSATLGLAASAVHFRGHFDRPNLRLEVRQKRSPAEQLDEMAAVATARHAGRPGIVYALSRADAERVAGGLSERGVPRPFRDLSETFPRPLVGGLSERGVRAAAYHAGLEAAARQAVQRAWEEGALQVVVATVAFGLGIDKPDVRFVLHHTVSKSLEAYYQEAGRAGRDGRPSDVIAWWRPADLYRLSSMAAEARDRRAAMAQLTAAGPSRRRGSHTHPVPEPS